FHSSEPRQKVGRSAASPPTRSRSLSPGFFAHNCTGSGYLSQLQTSIWFIQWKLPSLVPIQWILPNPMLDSSKCAEQVTHSVGRIFSEGHMALFTFHAAFHDK